MKASNRCFLDRVIHSLDLPVGQGVKRLCQTMFNAISMAYHIEPVGVVGFCSRAFGELCAIIRQHGMNPVRQLQHGIFEEFGCLLTLCLTIQPGMNKL